MMNKLNKITLIILTVILVTIGALFFIYSKTPLSTDDYSASKKHSDLTITEKNDICTGYNNGLRSGSCTEDAPSYCTTVYYPPSCKGCQDGEGCGYRE